MNSTFVVSRYKIVEELGRGGMGVVYKALDTRLNRMVALKVLEKYQRSKDIKRFIHEVRALSQLNHPNIIRIYEYGETPKPFFTMEIVEGDNLSNFFKKNKSLCPKKIAEIIEKITEAICEVHKMGIIHRDIKPSNIMLTHSKQPKLMDFGLAKSDMQKDHALSVTGEILGSIAYMSPEQAKGKAEIRSDIYSLGATLYEGLTGQKVFSSDSTYETIYSIFNETPKPPREINPQTPIELENICIKCLEKKLQSRYQTAFELLRDLRNFRNNRKIKAKRSENKSSIAKLFSYIQTIVLVISIFLCCLLWITKISQQEIIAGLEKQKKSNIQQIVSLQKKLDKKALYLEQQQVFIRKEKQSLKKKKGFIANYLHQLGRSLRMESKYDEALAIYKFAKTVSDHTNIFIGAGVTYLCQAINENANKDLLFKAIDHLSIALENELKNKTSNKLLIDIYSNRAVAYALVDKEKECAQDFNTCSLLDGLTYSFYANRALAYHLLFHQDKNNALRDLNKAISLETNNKNLLKLLTRQIENAQSLERNILLGYFKLFFR